MWLTVSAGASNVDSLWWRRRCHLLRKAAKEAVGGKSIDITIDGTQNEDDSSGQNTAAMMPSDRKIQDIEIVPKMIPQRMLNPSRVRQTVIAWAPRLV